MVAQRGGKNSDGAAGRPGIFAGVVADVGKNDIAAAHDAAAEDNQFRTVSVDEADGSDSPNMQAAIADAEGDGIAFAGQLK